VVTMIMMGGRTRVSDPHQWPAHVPPMPMPLSPLVSRISQGGCSPLASNAAGFTSTTSSSPPYVWDLSRVVRRTTGDVVEKHLGLGRT
jgi:hypothetical protein